MLEPKDVRHLAALSRLCLDETEERRIVADLAAILEMVDALAAVNTEGIPPADQRAPFTHGLRDDDVGISLAQDEALANGPHVVAGYFRVPRILKED